MYKKILILSVLALAVCSFAYFGEKSDVSHKSNHAIIKFNADDGFNSVDKKRLPNTQFVNTPMVFEGAKYNGDYWIGPEIPITGLTGYCDYQFNGSQPHYLNRHSPTVMHAIYMLTLDSTAPTGPTRRTKYSFSDDDGATWQDLGEVPSNFRSGFPSVNAKNDGSAVISNHYLPPSGDLTAHINYDLLPGGGTFTAVRSDPTINFIWPVVSRLTNGNILTAGMSYRGAAATDTPVVSVFNSTSNTFGPDIPRLTAAQSHSNASLASACGPGGKAIFVINAYRETGGNYGQSRIFKTESNDNGQTWGAPVMIFDPHIILGDTAVPNTNGATDVIYDDAGNYYVAFNSLGLTGFWADARLYVSKNGGEPTLVSGGPGSPVNPIPESVTEMQQQGFMASFDHPCLSISADQQYIFVSFSVCHQADTLNGWNKMHIYYSWSSLSNLQWQAPIKVTNSGPNSFDERYASIATRTPVANGQYTLYFSYQKDTQPGSHYFDNAPLSRSFMVFRQVFDATNPVIGIKKNTEIVNNYRLDQNYPNPFNPTTKIGYNLAARGYVTLKLYNVLGEEVRTLVNGLQPEGYQEVDFSAANLPSGVYFYTINVLDQSGSGNNFSETKKMLLVK